MPPTETQQHGHILVVDDNRMNRIKLIHMLEEQGHTVAAAQQGREALQLLRAQPFDVVLLDLLMPEMDGFQALEAIKSDPALRDTVVIIISALEEMASVVRCIEMGAEDYLAKPFDPVLLQARLKNSLEKKKMRDLERAYLQQEMMLRQNEKLATLGKLSAGLAHELNNPAAAAKRGAASLANAIAHLQAAQQQLYRQGLSASQEAALQELAQTVVARVVTPLALDSLTRGDREEDVERWLADNGVDNSWELAADLVSLGYDQATLGQLRATLGGDKLAAVVTWVGATYTLYALAGEVSQATSRISEIVSTLKSYTYMDQAPVQQIDLHQGIEDTLTMLHHKVKAGITVQRDYAADLPRIVAYGGELNQAWTHLLENALTAMGETGQLTLRTRLETDQVVVTIEDTGHGIPETILPKIFDPFFTTRPPGEGSGLGLSVVHQIITHRHKGTIEVRSRPGETAFQVRLPLHSLLP
jgi:signal transduction histidine kinase